MATNPSDRTTVADQPANIFKPNVAGAKGPVPTPVLLVKNGVQMRGVMGSLVPPQGISMVPANTVSCPIPVEQMASNNVNQPIVITADQTGLFIKKKPNMTHQIVNPFNRQTSQPSVTVTQSNVLSTSAAATISINKTNSSQFTSIVTTPGSAQNHPFLMHPRETFVIKPAIVPATKKQQNSLEVTGSRGRVELVRVYDPKSLNSQPNNYSLNNSSVSRIGPVMLVPATASASSSGTTTTVTVSAPRSSSAVQPVAATGKNTMVKLNKSEKDGKNTETVLVFPPWVSKKDQSDLITPSLIKKLTNINPALNKSVPSVPVTSANLTSNNGPVQAGLSKLFVVNCSGQASIPNVKLINSTGQIGEKTVNIVSAKVPAPLTQINSSTPTSVVQMSNLSKTPVSGGTLIPVTSGGTLIPVTSGGTLIPVTSGGTLVPVSSSVTSVNGLTFVRPIMSTTAGGLNTFSTQFVPVVAPAGKKQISTLPVVTRVITMPGTSLTSVTVQPQPAQTQLSTNNSQGLIFPVGPRFQIVPNTDGLGSNRIVHFPQQTQSGQVINLLPVTGNIQGTSGPAPRNTQINVSSAVAPTTVKTVTKPALAPGSVSDKNVPNLTFADMLNAPINPKTLQAIQRLLRVENEEGNVTMETPSTSKTDSSRPVSSKSKKKSATNVDSRGTAIESDFSYVPTTTRRATRQTDRVLRPIATPNYRIEDSSDEDELSESSDTEKGGSYEAGEEDASASDSQSPDSQSPIMEDNAGDGSDSDVDVVVVTDNMSSEVLENGSAEKGLKDEISSVSDRAIKALENLNADVKDLMKQCTPCRVLVKKYPFRPLMITTPVKVKSALRQARFLDCSKKCKESFLKRYYKKYGEYLLPEKIWKSMVMDKLMKEQMLRSQPAARSWTDSTVAQTSQASQRQVVSRTGDAPAVTSAAVVTAPTLLPQPASQQVLQSLVTFLQTNSSHSSGNVPNLPVVKITNQRGRPKAGQREKSTNPMPVIVGPNNTRFVLVNQSGGASNVPNGLPTLVPVPFTQPLVALPVTSTGNMTSLPITGQIVSAASLPSAGQLVSAASLPSAGQLVSAASLPSAGQLVSAASLHTTGQLMPAVAANPGSLPTSTPGNTKKILVNMYSKNNLPLQQRQQVMRVGNNFILDNRFVIPGAHANGPVPYQTIVRLPAPGSHSQSSSAAPAVIQSANVPRVTPAPPSVLTIPVSAVQQLASGNLVRYPVIQALPVMTKTVSAASTRPIYTRPIIMTRPAVTNIRPVTRPTLTVSQSNVSSLPVATVKKEPSVDRNENQSIPTIAIKEEPVTSGYGDDSASSVVNVKSEPVDTGYEEMDHTASESTAGKQTQSEYTEMVRTESGTLSRKRKLTDDSDSSDNSNKRVCEREDSPELSSAVSGSHGTVLPLETDLLNQREIPKFAKISQLKAKMREKLEKLEKLRVSSAMLNK